MKSFNVRFWNVSVKKGRKRPFVLRWVVEKEIQTLSFTTRALADSYKAQLIHAARRGEAFDTESGLPDSMMRKAQEITWCDHVRSYVDDRWNKVSGRQRKSIAETLTAVTPVLVKEDKGEPDREILREALWQYAYNKTGQDADQRPEIAEALGWVAKVSVPITDLMEYEVITKALEACARNLDGTASAPSYYTRRRRVLYNVLKYAVSTGRLTANPIDGLDWKAPETPPCDEVDPAVVASPDQIRELLTAVSYAEWRRGPRMVAFFACMYFAMMRPGEVVALRESDCHLPPAGWGRLMLGESKPVVGTKWTDDGQHHETRGLKGRRRKEKRPVPIPPELVKILRHHINRFGVASDGRLFRTERGGAVLQSGYGRTWKKARPLALTPTQVASDLARRPYDLRHAGVSFRLNAGVPATQVAEWAGHSVEVLLKIYAKCIDGQDQVWRDMLDRALGDDGDSP